MSDSESELDQESLSASEMSDHQSDEDEKSPASEPKAKAKPIQKTKPLDRKTAQEFAEKVKKRGICYLSRIPPFMKPQKMRSLLEIYGPINRLYLKPEGAVRFASGVRKPIPAQTIRATAEGKRPVETRKFTLRKVGSSLKTSDLQNVLPLL
jgi:ESF2/ABP1 family protein